MNDSELEKNLKKYAQLITRVGVNVQKGQTIILYASVRKNI